VLAERCSNQTHGSPAETSRPVSRPIHRGPRFPPVGFLGKRAGPSGPVLLPPRVALRGPLPIRRRRTAVRVAAPPAAISRPLAVIGAPPVGGCAVPIDAGAWRPTPLAHHVAGEVWEGATARKGAEGAASTLGNRKGGRMSELLEAKTSFLGLQPAFSWSEPRASSGRCQLEGETIADQVRGELELVAPHNEPVPEYKGWRLKSLSLSDRLIQARSTRRRRQSALTLCISSLRAGALEVPCVPGRTTATQSRLFHILLNESWALCARPDKGKAEVRQLQLGHSNPKGGGVSGSLRVTVWTCLLQNDQNKTSLTFPRLKFFGLTMTQSCLTRLNAQNTPADAQIL
jgi:hypothetical protein